MSTDRENYVKAMIAGNVDACIRIEQKHGLFGYTPELVCVGLSAVEAGRNPIEAIDAYLDELDEDDTRVNPYQEREDTP